LRVIHLRSDPHQHIAIHVIFRFLLQTKHQEQRQTANMRWAATISDSLSCNASSVSDQSSTTRPNSPRAGHHMLRPGRKSILAEGRRFGEMTQGRCLNSDRHLTTSFKIQCKDVVDKDVLRKSVPQGLAGPGPGFESAAGQDRVRVGCSEPRGPPPTSHDSRK
jgi:hypothetical protein